MASAATKGLWSQVEKLDFENVEKQERINRALRDLDRLASGINNDKGKVHLFQEVAEIQARLRGK